MTQYIKVVIAVALFAFGVLAGWTVRDNLAKQAVIDASREALTQASVDREAAQASSEATQEVSERVAAETQVVQTRTVEIIREVPRYVTIESNRRCDVPDGFVRLHDAAASGDAPIPYGPRESPDTPSGVEISTVAETVAENYGQCLIWRSQVKGW